MHATAILALAAALLGSPSAADAQNVPLDIAVAAPGVPGRTEPGAFGSCGDDAWLEGMIGKRVADAVAEAMGRGVRHRVLDPGQPASEEFIPDRVQIHTDGKGAVAGASCG